MPSCEFQNNPDCKCRDCQDPDERQKEIDKLFPPKEEENLYIKLEEKGKIIKKYKELLKNAMRDYKQISDALSREYLDMKLI
jgi:predicted helicase